MLFFFLIQPVGSSNHTPSFSISNPGIENKVVLKSYSKDPVLSVEDDVLIITAGDDCDGVVVEPIGEPVEVEDSSAARGMVPLIAAAIPLVAGAGWPAVVAAAFATQFTMTQAQTALECQLTPIEVMVYVGSEADEIVMREAQSGDFEVCPPESLYWKHHPVRCCLVARILLWFCISVSSHACVR